MLPEQMLVYVILAQGGKGYIPLLVVCGFCQNCRRKNLSQCLNYKIINNIINFL